VPQLPKIKVVKCAPRFEAVARERFPGARIELDKGLDDEWLLQRVDFAWTVGRPERGRSRTNLFSGSLSNGPRHVLTGERTIDDAIEDMRIDRFGEHDDATHLGCLNQLVDRLRVHATHYN